MVAWTLLSNSPNNTANAMWLMQDGTVLVCLTDCYTLKLLHPDSTGSYASGWWSDAGQFLLAKNDFASAVLSDGRLVACGGEHSGTQSAPHTVTNNTETNFCEIYDPVRQRSTQFSGPLGWNNIGDAPTAVLPDGTMLLGDIMLATGKVAVLDPATLTWRLDGGENLQEQGYVLLQTGDVLTASGANQTSLRYDPSQKAFVQDENVPVALGTGPPSVEIGPGITMMNGHVIWFGATGQTAIYTPGGEGQDGTWVKGPPLPTQSDKTQLVCNDTGAILEPNGKVFAATWWGTGGPQQTGTVVFVEYDPVKNTINTLGGTPQTANREATKMLLLPNGHGLVSISALAKGDKNGLYDVTFDSGSQASWHPTITSFPSTVAFPPTAPLNKTVTLTGTQLCGLSECQHYGDDNQQAEHYPMVRFIDNAGVVTYARAHDVSTRSIAPNRPASVLVDIPPLAPGTYDVEAVAMGIPSRPATVKVVLERDRNSCLGLVASLEQRLLDRGPKVRVAERAGIIAELAICYQDGSLDRQEYEHALSVLEEINAPIQQP